MEFAKAKQAARELLREAWRRRDEIWPSTRYQSGILPIDPFRIAHSLLHVTITEPEDIPSDSPGIDIAGFIDRRSNEIVVAQRFKRQWRRFTAAHEIGHWLLHPQVTYRRERPLAGAEVADFRRPREELEADAFAGELLIPAKQLRRAFIERFGEVIDGREPDEDLAFRLRPPGRDRINPHELSEKPPRFRAMLVAQAQIWGGRPMVSLAEQFDVSTSAVAIQLVEYRLVR